MNLTGKSACKRKLPLKAPSFICYKTLMKKRFPRWRLTYKIWWLLLKNNCPIMYQVLYLTQSRPLLRDTLTFNFFNSQKIVRDKIHNLHSLDKNCLLISLFWITFFVLQGETTSFSAKGCGFIKEYKWYTPFFLHYDYDDAVNKRKIIHYWDE